MTIEGILADSNTTAKNLNFYIKDGVYGSGGHSIYQQTNNEKTRNIILFMFCIIRITDADTDAVVFEEQLAASPFAMRPLFLVLGKEIRSNLDDIQHAVKERQNNSKFSIIDTSFLNDKLHIISTKK